MNLDRPELRCNCVHYAKFKAWRMDLAEGRQGFEPGQVVTALLWASQLQSCGTFHAWLSALQ